MRVPPARILFPPEDRAAILAMIDESLTSGQLTLGPIGRELEAAFAAPPRDAPRGRRELRHRRARDHPARDRRRGPRGRRAGQHVLRHRGRGRCTPARACGSSTATRRPWPSTRPTSRRCLGPDTAAVVIVHIGGLVTPAIDEIARLCATHGVALVEDAAHAHGSAFDGRSAGRFGSRGELLLLPDEGHRGRRGRHDRHRRRRTSPKRHASTAIRARARSTPTSTRAWAPTGA